jgi:hypothetical protein
MENASNSQYTPGNEINVDNHEDVNYWTAKFGVPAEGLTSAIKAAGSNLVETVQEWFSKNKQSS